MIRRPDEVHKSLGNVYSYKQGYSSWKEFIDDRGEEGFKQFLKDLYDRDYLKKTRTQSSKCS
jgi:hypothetical protein